MNARTLINAYKWFALNPRLFQRKLAARLRRYRDPNPLREGNVRVHNATFPYNFEFGDMVRAMYYGDYEPDVCMCLESLLKPGATFVDVGANVGYLSAMACGLVCPNGQVHSFEPVPVLFQQLKQVADANNNNLRFYCNQVALGDRKGCATIRTSRTNAGWNTMVPGFMHDAEVAESFQVNVVRLDDYLEQRKVERVDVLKIDVEGFELPVLRGMSRFLARTPYHPAILCEVACAAYPKLGISLSDLEDFMSSNRYQAYDPINRKPITISELRGTTNVLFLAEGLS